MRVQRYGCEGIDLIVRERLDRQVLRRKDDGWVLILLGGYKTIVSLARVISREEGFGNEILDMANTASVMEWWSAPCSMY